MEVGDGGEQRRLVWDARSGRNAGVSQRQGVRRAWRCGTGPAEVAEVEKAEERTSGQLDFSGLVLLGRTGLSSRLRRVRGAGRIAAQFEAHALEHEMLSGRWCSRNRSHNTRREAGETAGGVGVVRCEAVAGRLLDAIGGRTLMACVWGGWAPTSYGSSFYKPWLDCAAAKGPKVPGPAKQCQSN